MQKLDLSADCVDDVGMWAAVTAVYRQSKKLQDNFWTEWVSRPPAAVLVWLLRPTPVTPNQVTFLALAVFAGAVATLIGWRTHVGLLTAALIVQVAYILDCVDGQLARSKGQTSPVGGLLDFLMDEIKALLLLGGVAVRLWLRDGRSLWLLLGLGGVLVAACGMTLTSFMRRPEYLATAPEPRGSGGAPGLLSLPIRGLEWIGRTVLHYPTYFILIAAVDRVDIFFYMYSTAHALYLGRASLAVLLRLGRPLRPPPQGS